MDHKTALQQIRENERQSHMQVYSTTTLFQSSGWLQKPIKTVLELFSYFEGTNELAVLDLGSGVGRNAIPIAQNFSSVPCSVVCVDILELAIEKLKENADKYQVSSQIQGIVSPIEAFTISENQYDLILSVSALEHIDSEENFTAKLREIETGVKPGGMVCFVINSEVIEEDALTGTSLLPQFEVNLPAHQLMDLLEDVYREWEKKKVTIRPQEYKIPRGSVTSLLQTKVVTFVAKKQAACG